MKLKKFIIITNRKFLFQRGKSIPVSRAGDYIFKIWYMYILCVCVCVC